MSFQIKALEPEQFQHLFDANESELKQARAMRMKVTQKPGFPCRISLVDAEVGEEVILAHFEHLDVDTPFHASHAVYLRPNGAQAKLEVNEIPALFGSRILSVRAFSEPGMLIAADLAEGSELGPTIERMLLNPEVAFLHLHFAKPGCYAARVDRAR